MINSTCLCIYEFYKNKCCNILSFLLQVAFRVLHMLTTCLYTRCICIDSHIGIWALQFNNGFGKLSREVLLGEDTAHWFATEATKWKIRESVVETEPMPLQCIFTHHWTHATPVYMYSSVFLKYLPTDDKLLSHYCFSTQPSATYCILDNTLNYKSI